MSAKSFLLSPVTAPGQTQTLTKGLFVLPQQEEHLLAHLQPVYSPCNLAALAVNAQAVRS